MYTNTYTIYDRGDDDLHCCCKTACSLYRVAQNINMNGCGLLASHADVLRVDETLRASAWEASGLPLPLH